MKVCSKCGRELPLSEFSKDKSRKDGIMCYCRECSREIVRKYRKANLEKVKESDSKYYEANPEKVKEKNRKYRENCPDSYVRNKLIGVGIPSEEITQELIEIKRKAILIIRQIKQIKNGLQNY